MGPARRSGRQKRRTNRRYQSLPVVQWPYETGTLSFTWLEAKQERGAAKASHRDKAENDERETKRPIQGGRAAQQIEIGRGKAQGPSRQKAIGGRTRP